MTWWLAPRQDRDRVVTVTFCLVARKVGQQLQRVSLWRRSGVDGLLLKWLLIHGEPLLCWRLFADGQLH